MTIITNVNVGRALTAEETAARDAYIAEQVTAELTNGQSAGVYYPTSGIRVWSTMDAANAYVAWANANYNPAPVLAVAQTI